MVSELSDFQFVIKMPFKNWSKFCEHNSKIGPFANLLRPFEYRIMTIRVSSAKREIKKIEI